MHYKEFATRMREQMPNTLSNMDDRAIADLAIKRKPQYASMISFDEPVVEQPIQETQNNNSTQYIDALNNMQADGMGFLNAFKKQQELDAQSYDMDNIAKQEATRKLAELDQWKKEHPVLSIADDLANITSPFQAEWELRAKYGNNAPLEEVLKTKGKQALLGGTGVVSTVLPAGAFVKTAKIASIANKASKAKKLSDALKSTKYGAIITGVPSVSENIERVIDGEQNVKDALANTTKDIALGAAGGALGYGLSGLTTKGILNKVEADVANKYFSKAIKGGNQLSDPRKLETLQKQAVKKLMDSHKGAAIKTADGLVAGLTDAAVIGSADYGLNKLQGKQQEPYIDHMKPYMGFGLGAGFLPGAFHYLGKPVEKALKSDVIKGAISKNEFMSNLVGEGANAFGVKTDIPRAKQYQELGEKVKDYDMPAAKHYTSKEMAEADSTKNLSPKERRIYLNYLKNGFTKEEAMAKATSQSNSKFDEMHAKAEQEQKQDFTENIFGTKQEERPTVKNQIVPVDTSKKQIVPIDNVDISIQKPKEHVAEPTNPVKKQGDINTPTNPQTHANEPASHVNLNNQQNTISKSSKKTNELVWNKLWQGSNEPRSNRVKTIGGAKYLENRFNSYFKEPEKAQAFYDDVVKRIDELDVKENPELFKKMALSELNEVADNFSKKNNIIIKKSLGLNSLSKGNNTGIAHSQNNIADDITTRKQRATLKIRHNGQKTLDNLKDVVDETEYKRLQKEIEDNAKIANSASEIISVSEYAARDKDFAKHFANQLDDDIDIAFIDGVNKQSPETGGQTFEASRAIVIYKGSPSVKTKGLQAIIRHEYQHALDLNAIYSDKEMYKAFQESNKIYQKALKHIKDNREYRDNVLYYLSHKNHNFMFDIRNSLGGGLYGGLSNQNDFFKLLNYGVKKKFLTQTDAKRLAEYHNALEVYNADILEMRAKKVENLEYNIPITAKELTQYSNKLKSKQNSFKTKLERNFRNADRFIHRESGDERSYESRTMDFGSSKTFSNRRRKNKGVLRETSRISKERIKDLHKTSIDIEQKRIKRGLITPEQAENRKKQLKSKYYIPMKTGNAPIEDTLDLTRNYNEGRETKVGLYGKGGKWKEHITPEKAVENLHIASVKTNFVDEIADYVEKNFAKPLNKNGTHDEDWVAVNAHLLWNGLAAKQSRSWYNLIDSGEDAIRKAFKNKEQADAFVELHNRTRNKDFQIPKQVFKKLLSGEGETAKEAFERYGLFNRHSIGKHVAALTDAFTDQFKRTVLGTSSFWVNNRFSNHLLLAANSENPARHIIDLYIAGKIKAKDMPQELLENSILEAVSQSTKRKTFSGYNTFDNIVNLFGGHTIDTKTLKGIKKATASVANVVIGYPNKVYNTIAEKLLNFNSKFENYERKVALLQQLRANEKDLVRKTGQQMLTVEEALKYLDKHPEMRSTIVKQVENVLGDYNNFTATEKQIIKRLIPFYSWFRTVARNTVHLAKKNPARFALIQYELHKLKEEDKDLKEWQKGAFRLSVKDKRSGKQLLVNKVNQVPWETLKPFGNETDIENSVNPLVKVPIEGILGKKFFGSGEITNKRYVSTFAGKNADGSNRYKYFDTKTKKETDKLPASTRVAYVSKELGKNFAPLLSNRLIGGESLLQGYDNYKKTGKFLEPDKLYDADFGGFHHGDIVGSKLKKNGGYKTFKRFATNNTSEEIKLLNRLGLTLQPKQDLSQADLAKLERATQKYKKKRKAS